MAAAYTKRETELLLKMHSEEATMAEMCVALNKTRKSVIAKLSKEGVYEKTGYRDKTGAVPENKIEIVHEIESYLGSESLLGLEKTPKLVLKKLRNYIRDTSEILEESLCEIAELSENNRILQDVTASKQLGAKRRESELEILFSEDDNDS